MTSPVQKLEITAFAISILIVASVVAFFARRRTGKNESVKEWGLGGGHFGTLVTWFLVGGEFYTAYTIIAVPALMYSTGAAGFFALPYTTLVYPFVYSTMPRLWAVCRRHQLITAADFVRLRYDSTSLSVAIALTGVLSLLPYIALQLIGMESIFVQMGMVPDSPLFRALPVAFGAAVLAAYTYSAGLRAPAMIAFAKDIMIYIVVIAAVIALPLKVGGYGNMFHRAEAAFTSAHHGASVVLLPSQFSAYATLALGSALAAFLYPHTTTSVLASGSAKVIRRNTYLLPAYTLLLGLIALLGLGGLSLGIHVENAKQIIPALLEHLFSPWFTGFCYAAIAVAALMPAAIMSIAAANLLSRNFYLVLLKPRATDIQQSNFAKRSSLVVTLGALLFSMFLPTHYAIDLQLLGGIWILQTLPAVILGLWTNWLHAKALLIAWFVSIAGGTWIAVHTGTITSTMSLSVAGGSHVLYIGIVALIVNLALAAVLTPLFARGSSQRAAVILPSDFEDED